MRFESASGGVILAGTAPGSGRGARRWGVPRWLRLLAGDPKSATGLAILGFFLLLCLVGPLIWSGDPTHPDYTLAPQQPPSAAHWFGTDHLNRDIWLQVVNGGRPTLFVGFVVGLCATILSVVIGMTAGYCGGWIDEVLSMITNIFLVIPALPLNIVLAAWLNVRNDFPVIFVITITSWAWGARVLRSQTLSIRQKDFVLAAQVGGESGARIILREVLPNMISLVAGSFIGTTVYAILTTVALQFLGFANNQEVSWGTILYWAQNSSAVETGAWWTYLFAGSAIALVATSLALINFGIDTISNPRLRTERVKLPRAGQAAIPSAEGVALS